MSKKLKEEVLILLVSQITNLNFYFNLNNFSNDLLNLGLYRLCGSATKKRILREAFERNARSVNLSPDNVPDINVITGKFFNYYFYYNIIILYRK